MGVKINCALTGHAGEWIIRREKVSIKDWNEWKRADPDQTQVMLIGFLEDWNLTGIDGKPAPKPTTVEALDVLDLKLLPWLINAITDSIIEYMKSPPQL